MKNILISIILIIVNLIFISSKCQVILPNQYKEKFNISNEFLSNENIQLGLVQCNNQFKMLNNSILKTYYPYCKTSSIKEKIKEPNIIILGYIGVDMGFVQNRGELFSNIDKENLNFVECVDVIAGIVKRAKVDMQISNINNLDILIYFLQDNSEILDELRELQIIETQSNFLYVIWDKGDVEELPLFFKNKKYYGYNIIKKEYYAANEFFDSNEEKVIKEEKSTDENNSIVENKATPVDEVKNQQIEIENISENVPKLEENKISIIDNENNITFKKVSPNLSNELKTIFLNYIKEKSINVRSHSYANFELADDNRSFITYNISINSTDDTLHIPLVCDSYKIRIEQDIIERRSVENDLEIKKISDFIYPQIKFFYKNQQLNQLHNKKEIWLSNEFSSINEIEAQISDTTFIKILKTNLISSKTSNKKEIELIISVKKVNVRFQIIDKQNDEEIQDVSLYIDYNKKNIVKDKINSGYVLRDMIYFNPNVDYTVSLYHPDFKFYKKTLSEKTWSNTQKIEMEPLKSFNIFYIDISDFRNKGEVYQKIERKLNKILKNKLDYLVFISFGNKPFVCNSGEDYKSTLNKILTITPSQPTATIDKQRLIEQANNDFFNLNEKVNFYYYLSKNVYSQSRTTLIDEVVKELMEKSGKKYDVYINLDYSPQEADKNNSYKYININY